MNDGMAQWQLAELAIKVGGLLGMTLDLTWWGPGVRIGTEGNGVHLAEPRGRPGYVEATGWYPARTAYGYRKGDRPSAAVRAGRGYRVIAAEIERRLLPAYRATMVKVGEADEADRAAQRAREQLAAYVTGLFPAGKTSMPAHCQTGSRAEVIVYLPGHLGGYVKISLDGGEVEFERFRVPAGVALRMLETAALLAGPAGG